MTDGDARAPQVSALRLAVLPALVLLIAWICVIDTPFARVYGYADWIGNWNARIAANYARYGLGATMGAQIMNLEAAAPADWVLYHGHPATLDLWTAGMFGLFGSQAVWVQRFLPLLASILTLFVFAVVAAKRASSPRIAVWTFASLPIFFAHGINLSYEPFCVPILMLVIEAYRRERRGLALLGLYLGGLVDFPVLYVAPFLALIELSVRERTIRERLVFGALLGGVALASLSTHLLHVGLAHSALPGHAGVTLADKIFGALSSGGQEPAIGVVIEKAARHFADAFTWPGIALLCVGLWFGGRGLNLQALAFAFVGVLHCVLFRGHFVQHDFWPYYLLPFVALAVAEALARFPRRIAAAAVVVLALLGANRSFGLWSDGVWSERRMGDVRGVAADLREVLDSADAASSRAVVHYLGEEPGWAVESLRGVAVVEGRDLALQILGSGEGRGDFGPFLDNLAGTWGYLARPQRAVLPAQPDRVAEHRARVEEIFGEPLAERRAASGRSYWIYDAGPLFLGSGSNKDLLVHVREPRLEQLRERARMLVALSAFAAGDEILWLEGEPPAAPGSQGGARRPSSAAPVSAQERFRGRVLGRGGQTEVEAWKPESGRYLACAGDSGWAARLKARFAGRYEIRTAASATGPLEIVVVQPR